MAESSAQLVQARGAAVVRTTPATQPRVSVIIPALNEEASIGRTLRQIMHEPGIEIIVVDGGSTDATLKIARSFDAQVLQTSPSRGGQMNTGARVATGDVLMFLHADTIAPTGLAVALREALEAPNVIAGAFALRIDASGRGYRMVEAMVRRRSRRRQLPYGDQAIFLRRETFIALGGFPDIAVMEDLALVRQLRRQGRIVLLDTPVTTSSRRWARHGIVRTTLHNSLCTLAYAAGISPHRIAQWRQRRAR